MKRLHLFYWLITGLFSAFMLLSAIPNIAVNEESKVFLTQLGYPIYFIPFIGVAKALGSIMILVPAFPRLKEWAYAGLFFDLAGAMYSIFCAGTPPLMGLTLLLPITFGAISYLLHHKRLKLTTQDNK